MKLCPRTCSVLLLCCTLPVARAAIGKKTPPAVALDLNTATTAQLAQVPGIGAVTAKAIVQFRQKSGPFERVEDLLAIRGISARKLEQIRPYVTVSKPAPRKPSSSRGSWISSAYALILRVYSSAVSAAFPYPS
jgi:competence protein ComEA